MPACAACGTENVAGRKFCGGCGAPLARACPSCGSANEPGMRFCGECGGPLDAEPAPAPAVMAAERRLVSVLFADLVGFTPLSETRDPEEVRELLSRYFDRSRRLIEIYGGTVEKFIGDAVMAVWGTPVAQEDDAERAVRAGLDLVAAVAQLGEEVGAPGLRARAGVLTGEAAVTLGAAGEGMVAGDLVNTASRVQAAAEAGTVLVGETTKRASDAAIAYDAAGSFELKGKAEPVPLYRAVRVTSVRGGAVRTGELEPPFVGRQRELNHVKELAHATAEEQKAHLVSVIGIGGIGKSRLAWEFEKYMDGVAELVYWHRGRCLAYGDGVAYWALAEMIRMRALIAEDDPPAVAESKLGSMLDEWLTDPDERAFVEPRLAQLLGIGEPAPDERQNLFSAWRLFIERMAARGPVILVFEDLQWADPSLLDFIEHLLDWSRAHPIFVLALARPELAERRHGFAAGGRNATTLSLEPLPGRAMGELLDGFVPGLPRDLHARILERAEGVPLYAVETVRMLLDRGLLEREGDVYRPTGTIDALEVPETLHALIAARLDGLSADERRVLQDAAVLGKSFTKLGVAALSGLDDDRIEQILTSLVRKEVLSVQADPRSPERGQYSFLQDLLKRIAYDTLSRADRKARHLAAAAHLERSSASEHELVEVIAAHYVDAYESMPDAPDASELRAAAAGRLTLAGERAASLGALEEAQHYFVKASGLADDDLALARLIERAGTAALEGGRHEAAVELLDRAIGLYNSVDETHPAARVTARLGLAMWRGGDLRGGADRLEQALQVLADDEPDAEIAKLIEVLARLSMFLGEHDRAWDRVERALEIAEGLGVAEVLADALNTKCLLLAVRGRPAESGALLDRALEIARDNDLVYAQLRAINNKVVQLILFSRFGEGLAVALEGVEVAQRAGQREHEQQMLGQTGFVAWMLGDWDLVAEARDRLATAATAYPALMRAAATVALAAPRAELETARRALDEVSWLNESDDAQLRSGYLRLESQILHAEGRFAEAAEAATAAREIEWEVHARLDPMDWLELQALADAGDVEGLEEALARTTGLGPLDRTPLHEAMRVRFRGRLDALQGNHSDAIEALTAACARFATLGVVYIEALTRVELADVLAASGDADAAQLQLASARETFVRLGAAPWVERVDAVATAS